MAYANKYYLSFKNRQNDTYTAYILEKDFVGTAEELEGGGDPCIFDYGSGDDQPWLGIRGCAVRLSFYNNGSHPLSLFLSNNDDQFKVEIYRGSTLEFTGFLLQGDSSEPMVKPSRYLVTLQATDNLGLLKDLTFDEDEFTPNNYAQLPIYVYFYHILLKTGMDLPINDYCNLFEQGMNDRTAFPEDDPFFQSYIDTRTFLKDEAKFDNCYNMLDKILRSWQCALSQSEGEWRIIRWPELKDFNNLIPGTRYETLFAIPSAVSLGAVKDIGLNLEIEPLNANHVKTTLMARKEVALTYNFEQQNQTLINANLLILGSQIATSTFSGVITTDYALSGITHENGGTAFIRVETNELTGTEVNRYIVMPFSNTKSRIRFEDILVSENDRSNLSISYRANTNIGDVERARMGMYILNSAGTHYAFLNKRFALDGTTSLYWSVATVGSSSAPGYIGIYRDLDGGDNDLTEWSTFDAQWDVDVNTETIPPFPFDGVLSVVVQGYNSDDSGADALDTYVNNFKLETYSYINKSTKITGQVHSTSQEPKIKKKYEEEIYIDDGPKSNIKGVMYLSDQETKTSAWKAPWDKVITEVQLTHLGSDDFFQINGHPEFYDYFINGESITLSGTVSNDGTYVISSKSFILAGNFTMLVDQTVTDETAPNATVTFNRTRPFGDIQAIDLMFLQDELRTRVEGDYFGIKQGSSYISLMSVFTIATLPNCYFILGQVSINKMRCEWSGTLEQIWDDTKVYNPYNYTNIFKYLYKT